MSAGKMTEKDVKSMLRGIAHEEDDVRAKRVEFPELKQQNISADRIGIDLLKDIIVDITVELGHCQLTVNEILHLDNDSVVELDKIAGEEVDIHINTEAFAKAEVVVINESFGIRINSFQDDPEE